MRRVLSFFMGRAEGFYGIGCCVALLYCGFYGSRDLGRYFNHF